MFPYHTKGRKGCKCRHSQCSSFTFERDALVAVGLPAVFAVDEACGAGRRVSRPSLLFRACGTCPGSLSRRAPVSCAPLPSRDLLLVKDALLAQFLNFSTAFICLWSSGQRSSCISHTKRNSILHKAAKWINEGGGGGGDTSNAS